MWTNYFDADVKLDPSSKDSNSSGDKRQTAAKSSNSDSDFATIATGVTVGVLAGATILYGLKELFGGSSCDANDEDKVAEAQDLHTPPVVTEPTVPAPATVSASTTSSSRPRTSAPTPKPIPTPTRTQAATTVTTTAPPTRPSANVVLAVSASPKRGAGVMVLHDSSEVYHYSLDWTNLLDFTLGELQSKYETTNAYIALELFSPIIEALQEQNPQCKVVLKVDKLRFESESLKRLSDSLGEGESEETSFWNYVQELRGDICNAWTYVDMGQTDWRNDPELNAAEGLSKVEDSDSALRARVVAVLHPSYTRRVNCDGAALRALKKNLDVFPSNYLPRV